MVIVALFLTILIALRVLRGVARLPRRVIHLTGRRRRAARRHPARHRPAARRRAPRIRRGARIALIFHEVFGRGSRRR